MSEEGKICKWYLEGEGRCFPKGCFCFDPKNPKSCFTVDMPDRGEESTYEPGNRSEYRIRNKWQARKDLGIRRGDLIAEEVVPDWVFEKSAADPNIVVREAVKIAVDKIKKAGSYVPCRGLGIYPDVVIYTNGSEEVKGVYIIARGARE